MAKTLRNFAALAAFALAGTAFADPISISAGCPGDTDCDPTVEDEYSFLWTVAGGVGNETDGFSTFDVSLTNTSPETEPEAIIPEFGFNLTDFDGTLSFTDVNPESWTITSGPGAPVTFEYVGSSESNGAGAGSDALFPGQSLTFTMAFSIAQSFDVFLDAESTLGTGFAGGDDSGQVCVKFRNLANDGSDLVCGEYGDTPTTDVSEPATLGLLGLGLLGVGFARRRRMATLSA